MIVVKNIISKTILCLIPIFTLTAIEQTAEGRIFRKEGDKELLYIQKEYVRIMENFSEISHVYFKEDQTEAAFEKVTIEQGELEFYEVGIEDLDSYGSITREGDELKVYFRQSGKEKTREIPYERTLVTGPQLPEFIQNNKDSLIKGETVYFHLPFLERQTIIPFQLIPRENNSRENRITVQMKLKNFFLGMLIDPVDFILERSSGRVLEIHGPTILPDPYSLGKNSMVNTQIYYNYF